MENNEVMVLGLKCTVQNEAPVFTQSAKNERVPLHRHTYIEIFYVYDGVGVEEFNGERVQLKRGDARLLIPSDVHGFYKRDEGPFLRRDILISTSFFKGVCDFFSPSLFQDITSDKYNRKIRFSSEEIYSIESLAPSLFLNPNTKEYALAAKMLVTYLVNLLVSYNLKESSPAIPNWLNNIATRLSTSDNFKYDCSELIKDIAFTPDYIRRSFKKAFHMTMTDYYNKQKINYANYLLQRTDYTIEEICDFVGYTNLSYFYKLFLKTTGVTPSKARNAKKN